MGRRYFSAKPPPPQPPSSNAPSTRVLTTVATVAVFSVGMYAWIDHKNKEDELRLRHQFYLASKRHRHKLAALLVSRENRVLITDQVNTLVNMPGIGEHVEGILINRAVDQCMNALEQILVADMDAIGLEADPLAAAEASDDNDDDNDEDDNEETALYLVELLKDGTSLNNKFGPEDLVSAEESLVSKINAKVDIYGLREAQEALLIRGVVHQLLSLYPGIANLL